MLQDLIITLQSIKKGISNSVSSNDMDNLKKANKVMTVKGRSGNIRNKAKESILQFPLLVSDGISKDSVFMIKKALEVDYASYVKLIIGQDDIVDVNTPGAKKKYINKFHTNIAIDDGGEAIRDIFGILTNAYDAAGISTESVEWTLINSENLKVFSEDLRNESINDFTVSYTLQEMDKDTFDDLKRDDDYDKMLYDRKIRNNSDGVKSKSISVGDAKKANELAPTIIEMEIQYQASGILKTVNLILGIQCIVHPIDSKEMVYFIGRSIKENNLIFRFIQWTTGEIKFFRDFLFSVDRIKEEAQYSSKRTSKWWRRLRILSNATRLNSMFNKNKMIPNATMIMSMADVEELRNTNGIDMTLPTNVLKLLDIFFLLNFVIIDDIDEIAWVFNEDSKSFNTYSFDSLKKETTNGEKDLKSILSIITKK